MNVFEDLIEELKEANLLEETIIELGRSHSPASTNGSAIDGSGDEGEPALEFQTVADVEVDPSDPAVKELEFYRKRAMAEVSSLQMVEHVLSGVEREHMKMSPMPFDDLGVKKALHRFLQLAAEPGNDEFPDAEYNLMHEVQEWFAALSRRDANISVSNLRRFCENSKPALSSQALIALARFYRNSPFAEDVRGKFDFVITRLFSRELGDETRKQLFNRQEMVGHLRTLYTNWSSLDLYADEQFKERIAAAVEGFDGFAEEAKATGEFDTLVTGDFFNRVRSFKEETADLFYVSDVTGAAIACNIAVGNRFVELLRAESEAAPHNSVENRYGFSYDALMSSAASKTLHMLEILKEDSEEIEQPVEMPEEVEAPKVRAAAVSYEKAPQQAVSSGKILGINKWIFVGGLILLALSVGVYIWSSTVESSGGDLQQATNVQVTDPVLKQFVRDTRTSAETLYGIAEPAWDTKSVEEQKELLRKAYAMALSIQMKRVNILNAKGRTIGYATAEKVEVLTP